MESDMVLVIFINLPIYLIALEYVLFPVVCTLN